MRQLITRQFQHELTHHASPATIERREVNRGSGDTVIRFGRFCVLPRARQLLVDGQPIELGSRAFDLLMVLIEAPGTLVTKDDILSRVWPGSVVEENNLQVQISALRKVLGEDREVIKTIHGRGYVFAIEVTTAPAEGAALTPPGPAAEPHPLRPALPVSSPASRSPGRQWPIGARVTVPHQEAQPTVVIIDDDGEVREALQGLLQSVGLRVELFASVQEFLSSDRPDSLGCLVLDVRLPGRSGLDFHDDLARANVHLPVIFISGHADVPMSVRAMKAGAVEFLTKPVRHQDLLDAIQLAIEQDGARRGDEQAVA
jgi:DNA-binding response OmpR family regulator